MADHDHAALVLLQELAQPDDAVGVEVVGGLVEDHRVGAREQDARELDAAALTAGERLQLLIEDAVREREVRGDRGGFGLGRVAAEGEEAILELGVARHRGLADGGIRARHVDGGLLNADHQAAESACIEDAGAGGLLGISGARILRQVADLAVAIDLPAARHGLPRERLRQGRLARAVAADQPDLVPLVDSEGHLLHEEAGPHTDFEVLHGEHCDIPFLREVFDKRLEEPAR